MPVHEQFTGKTNNYFSQITLVTKSLANSHAQRTANFLPSPLQVPSDGMPVTERWGLVNCLKSASSFRLLYFPQRVANRKQPGALHHS